MTAHNTPLSIISSAHDPFDERIYYHFAKTLEEQGYKVSVLCSTKDYVNCETIAIDSFNSSGLSLEQKIDSFLQRLVLHKPSIIISLVPFTNYIAFRYKKKYSRGAKIIYDITEWHPSLSQLNEIKNPFNKIKKGIKDFVKNFVSLYLVDAFIFGEPAKAVPYKYTHPFKKSIIISYYPDKKYFQYPVQKKINYSEWTFGYCGVLNDLKGIFTMLHVIEKVCVNHSDILIKLMIIGWFDKEEDKIRFYKITDKIHNLKVVLLPKLPFEDFCTSIRDMDICFDLREKNFESNYGLPIKLFFYIANGKPVIYSDLQAIRNGVPEIEEFGFLVNPENIGEIAGSIEKYMLSKELYISHCEKAHRYFMDIYNWDRIAPRLHTFIKNLQ